MAFACKDVFCVLLSRNLDWCFGSL
uniref:Uncharacterized protein n=1 Tax=Rhizophora mucronata TaxID=61149 RepID=A0A2P2P5A6_RHIMU